jgi:hypothetical protein
LIERPSITVTKSLNSTATPLCEPPPMRTTRGASCVLHIACEVTWPYPACLQPRALCPR